MCVCVCVCVCVYLRVCPRLQPAAKKALTETGAQATGQMAITGASTGTTQTSTAVIAVGGRPGGAAGAGVARRPAPPLLSTRDPYDQFRIFVTSGASEDSWISLTESRRRVPLSVDEIHKLAQTKVIPDEPETSAFRLRVLRITACYVEVELNYIGGEDLGSGRMRFLKPLRGLIGYPDLIAHHIMIHMHRRRQAASETKADALKLSLVSAKDLESMLIQSVDTWRNFMRSTAAAMWRPDPTVYKTKQAMEYITRTSTDPRWFVRAVCAYNLQRLAGTVYDEDRSRCITIVDSIQFGLLPFRRGPPVNVKQEQHQHQPAAGPGTFIAWFNTQDQEKQLKDAVRELFGSQLKTIERLVYPNVDAVAPVQVIAKERPLEQRKLTMAYKMAIPLKAPLPQKTYVYPNPITVHVLGYHMTHAGTAVDHAYVMRLDVTIGRDAPLKALYDAIQTHHINPLRKVLRLQWPEKQLQANPDQQAKPEIPCSLAMFEPQKNALSAALPTFCIVDNTTLRLEVRLDETKPNEWE